MTVPKHRRGRARAEFVTQARVVLRQTQILMRKWPKSKLHLETQFVLRCAYEAYESAIVADTIYAVLPNEHAHKLHELTVAYGKINCLAGLCDDWIDNTPMVKNPRYEFDVSQPQFVSAVPLKKLENYSGTLCHAIGVFSGAIKFQRGELKKSLASSPNFVISLPITN